MMGTMAETNSICGSGGQEYGLYVHIPFCETKCGYCDFYSVPLKNRDPEPLVDAIVRELDTRVRQCEARIVTVFCGGGTPTLLPLPLLRRLLEAVNHAADPRTLTEFTVEANPATVDDEKASVLAAHGVTRVSMGAQSFHAEELATLERLHNADDIAPSVDILRRNKIEQINLDLIFGIPGQTVDSWLSTVDRATALHPDHIACYGLTYEPETRLTAQRDCGHVTPCPEEIEADMYAITMERLPQAGLSQYEISNYAKTGSESAHNLNYWRNGPYIGAGPSAAGFDGTHRYKNAADVGKYVRMMDGQGHAVAYAESVDRDAVVLETIMMQMRLVEGLSVAAFTEKTGVSPLVLFARRLESLSGRGLVRYDEGHIALTRNGMMVADAVIRELAAACGHTDRALPVSR